ncbi:LysR family transcriptional regulator [uncultured Photobacterium sp.]|uniref:LysR family transcriptional regulator n=1 Tax=uncultured Photobacterium sp. TaxID=173973 RepID=UPI00262B85F9|nr:LysR family transcriptional regulator [uncultured Photobacterium sp.]
MNNNLSLSDIKTFVAIVSLGNLTRAAETLGSSRAHVSRQLSQLEKDLGTQLLTRTTRTQKLTEAGEMFYQTCRSSLQAIDKAASDALEMNNAMTGKIYINSLGGVFGEEYTAKALAEFSLLYPEVQINLSFESRHINLIDEQYDLVIRAGELTDSSLISRPLMTMNMGLFASPEYLNKHGMVEHPDDLNKHRCVAGPIVKWQFQNSEGEQKDIYINPVMNCNNSRVLRQCALDGIGIIRLPSLYIEKDLKDKTLLPAVSGWNINSIPVHLIYNQQRYQPERIKVLNNFIYEWFNKKPAL